jgi:[protein-PII] uridylyltransferase
VQPLCDDFFEQVDPASPGAPDGANRAVRSYLAAVLDHLIERHDAGVPSRLVNAEHAELVDRLIRKLFRVAEDRYFATFPRLGSYRLAIAAVGGYGRNEMALASDVDLLFLYRGKMNPYVETITEAVMHRLWDARLTVGAATRTLADCYRIGRQDLSTLTSYLDARFLVGDAGLFGELGHEVRGWVRADPGHFIAAKLEERDDRHQRFGESPFLLQPNVRESVGGLRDYHTALWIAHAANWEVRQPDQFALQGFIGRQEQVDLLEALDFLWRVRNELHREGRKDDRLHYNAQERVAARLGFKGSAQTLAVEELMRAYYLQARRVQRVSEHVIEHAQRLEARRTGVRAPRRRLVEEGFAIALDHLEIPSASLLEERPARLLSAFAVAQRYDVELSTRALSLIRSHVELIDDDFRRDPEIRGIFLGILLAANRVYRTLERLNDVGVLGAYIPEFGWVVGMWQQDLYHTYTVDAHSLFLIEQLRRMGKGIFEQELALPTKLVREIRHPVPLLLGALLHDIGKGRGGGHSQKGADMVPEIGERLGLDSEAIDEVHFLVRHHLTLSGLAERRDVHDAKLILNVARLVGSRHRLRSLYLLTVADIRSVSSEAWTGWKAGLLETLYRNVAEWLEAGVGDESASGFFLERAMERAERTQSEALDALGELRVDRGEALGFLGTMPRRYLLTHGPSEIAEQVAAALDYAGSGQLAGVYSFRPQGERSAFQGLVVLAADRPGLLSTMCGILASAGRDVLGAQVYTSKQGLALEIYELAPLPGGDEEEEAERTRLERRLRQVLSGQREPDPAASARRRAAPVIRTRPPRVRISNEDSEFYTIVDVGATDRPGMLYDITRCLHEQGLDVALSLVTTRATRITDSFYVRDHGHKLLEPERRHEVEEALLRAIGQGGA